MYLLASLNANEPRHDIGVLNVVCSLLTPKLWIHSDSDEEITVAKDENEWMNELQLNKRPNAF